MGVATGGALFKLGEIECALALHGMRRRGTASWMHYRFTALMNPFVWYRCDDEEFDRYGCKCLSYRAALECTVLRRVGIYRVSLCCAVRQLVLKLPTCRAEARTLP
jgi:hypothetical protein